MPETDKSSIGDDSNANKAVPTNYSVSLNRGAGNAGRTGLHNAYKQLVPAPITSTPNTQQQQQSGQQGISGNPNVLTPVNNSMAVTPSSTVRSNGQMVFDTSSASMYPNPNVVHPQLASLNNAQQVQGLSQPSLQAQSGIQTNAVQPGGQLPSVAPQQPVKRTGGRINGMPVYEWKSLNRYNENVANRIKYDHSQATGSYNKKMEQARINGTRDVPTEDMPELSNEPVSVMMPEITRRGGGRRALSQAFMNVDPNGVNSLLQSNAAAGMSYGEFMELGQQALRSAVSKYNPNDPRVLSLKRLLTDPDNQERIYKLLEHKGGVYFK